MFDRAGGDRGAGGAVRMRELLAHDVLQGAQLVAGRSGLDNPVERLNVMTVPDILRWVKGHEFLLATGYPLRRRPEELADLVRQLHGRGLSGLGVKLGDYLPTLPPDVVSVADEVGLPLVVIPESIHFDDILSQVFSTIVNRQAAALAQAQEIHDAFLGIVLAGGSMETLARKLAALLRGASVAVCDQTGRVLAVAEDTAALRDVGVMESDELLDISRLMAGVHTDDASGRKWAVGVIRAGKMHHGFVVAVERWSDPFGPVAATAVDQAAVVAALEITRGLAISAVQRQFASNALHDLVTASESAVWDAASRGQAFGWDLERPICVLVCRQEQDPKARPLGRRERELAAQRAIEFWYSAVRARDSGAAAAGFTSELVAIVGTATEPAALARAVQAEMTSLTRRTYSTGVSRVVDGPTGIPKAYREARAALLLGARVSGEGAVTDFGELGLFRLLSQVSEDELRGFLEDTLGCVLALEAEERDDLLNTLEVLLQQGLNVAESSRVLFYHYNTLRYRIAKLERLVGPFMTDAEVALRLGVALRVLRMHGMSLSG